MNITMLPWCLRFFRNQGFTIEPNIAFLAAASLRDLRIKEKFRDIYLWGKIFGNKANYYIAYGYKSDILAARYHYYSLDCITWRRLGRTSRRDHQMALMVEEPFSGNPEKTFPVTPSPEEARLMAELAAQGDEDGEEGDEGGKSQLMEETRLAAVIALINWEASCVPRGGILRREEGYCMPNEHYSGLAWDEATDLRSYMHFRVPRRSIGANLRMRADYDLPYDFMDSLATDTLPSHSIVVDPTDALVIVRSLGWPGAVTVHKVESPHWAFLYVGGAHRKVLDMPHLLPTTGAVPPLRRPPPPAPPATPITEEASPPTSPREKGPRKSLLGDPTKKPAHTPEGMGLPSQKELAKKWQDDTAPLRQALADAAEAAAQSRPSSPDPDARKKGPPLGKTPKPICKKDKDPKRPPSVVAVPYPYYDSSASSSTSSDAEGRGRGEGAGSPQRRRRGGEGDRRRSSTRRSSMDRRASLERRRAEAMRRASLERRMQPRRRSTVRPKIRR